MTEQRYSANKELRLIKAEELDKAANLMADCFSLDPGIIAQMTGLAGGSVTGRALEVLRQLCFFQVQGFAAQRAVWVLEASDELQKPIALLIGYPNRQIPFWKYYPLLLKISTSFRQVLQKEEWPLIKQNSKAYASSAPTPAWRKKCCGKAYYYLIVAAVSAEYKGTGAFRRLIAPVLAACDDKQLPIVLETDNPKNIPIYEHFGFQTTETVANKTWDLIDTHMVR